MKKCYKIIVLLLVMASFTLLVGCGSKTEVSETKKAFEIKQKNDTVKVTLQDVKKGEQKEATITISEGQVIEYEYDISDEKKVNVTLSQENSTSIDDFLIRSELVNKASFSNEVSPGNYKLYITIPDDEVTGTVKISAK